MEKIFIPHLKYKLQADLYGSFDNQHTPLIIMAHGLGGEKQCGLGIYAKFYEKLGFKVCVFDHSGFGESTGSIKNLVDKKSQIDDWKCVIEFMNKHYGIQNDHIILWGYSFSGGHVLTLASEQKFKAVISNFPHVDGLASLTLYPKKYLASAALISLQDLALSTVGKIKTMPVVAKDRFAILAGEDCFNGYLSIIPKQMEWDNAVPARIVAKIGLYRPTTIVNKISIPTLITAALNDSLIPIHATRKTANKIKNAIYYELNCGHFDLFHDPFKNQMMSEHEKFLISLIQ